MHTDVRVYRVNFVHFPVSIVGNEDSFEQHKERFNNPLVLGEISKCLGTDERTLPGNIKVEDFLEWDLL